MGVAQERPTHAQRTVSVAAAGRPETTSDNRQTKHSQNGLTRVLAAEDTMRRCRTELELLHALSNTMRDLVGARQVVALRHRGRNVWRVSCLSSVATVERDAPFVRAVEAFASSAHKTWSNAEPIRTTLKAARASDTDVFETYPFQHVLLVPLVLRDETVFAGLLLLHDAPWDDDVVGLIKRQAAVTSDIWCAISGRRSLKPRLRQRQVFIAGGFLLGLAALAIPVPMTTIAPVEIVPDAPALVTSPLAGVVEDVLVAPNTAVKEGQALVRFVDTDLRNAHKLAEREADVADARYRRLLQAAFFDPQARHELTIAETERTLRLAERDYALERMNQTVLRAGISGSLIYQDKTSLVGRPVALGERLMRIARPGKVVADISLPVSDAIVLQRGADVRLFLDADPLRSVSGSVRTESYHARVGATGVLAYRVRVELDENTVSPRIGSRGTAQLLGAPVALGFFLFRRPIAWARQTFGV